MKIALAVILALVCHMAVADQVGKVCQSSSFYWNGTACTACPSGCSECVWKNNAVSCINCGASTGKYLKIVNDLGTCDACAGNCSICRGPAVSDCFKAADGFSVGPTAINKCSASNCLYCNSTGSCEKCQFGYRLANGACTICSDQYCAECPDAVSTCKKCQFQKMLSNGTCQSCATGCVDCPCTSCLSGYRFFNGTCTKCTDLKCLTCAQNESVCTSCLSGFFANTTCQACSEACKTCESGSKCTACVSGFSLNSDKCNKCPDYCTQCDGNGLCSACSSTYTLSSDKKQCTACPVGCTNCDNTGVCSTCYNGFILKSDKKGCDSCPGGCSVCSNSTTCTTCNSGYNPNGKGGCKAFISCQAGQQLDGNSTCTAGSIDNCVYGNNLTQTCVQCSTAYYGNGNKCTPCPNGCEKCSTDPNSYVSCSTLAQLGFSAIKTSDKSDRTGYIGIGNVYTVLPNETAAVCMPNYLVASPLLNQGNKRCVDYDHCDYPVNKNGNWFCYVPGSAVKITMSLFAVIVAALFTL